MAEDTQRATWQERRWKEIRGWIAATFVWILVLTIGRDVKNWISPAHPAPVSIEADGKSYVACNMPNFGRGYFQNTYYAEFEDNNGSTVSLRGIDKLMVTNLPQMIDAPMPVFRSLPDPLPDVNGVDGEGKPYQEGYTYAWSSDGSAAVFKKHAWVSVPGLPVITPSMEGKVFTYDEDEYRVRAAGKAQVKQGKWVPVKIKNPACNPDNDGQ
jgi:hypothetical protein